MNNSTSFIEFGKIAEFRNGLNFSKDSHGKGCKLIGIPDFQKNFIPEYEQLEEVNPDGITKDEDYLKRGDIIFVRSNGNKALVGRSLFIDRDVHALYSGFCIRARILNDIIDPLFLAYYTRTSFFKAAIGSVAGTNINNLNQDILGEVKVPLYPMEIQHSITSILSALDSKIQCNNRIITELETMAKTIYNYWFVQFDFPDEEGKPYKTSGGETKYNEKLKMEIPIGWTDGKLSEVANITMGQSPDGDSYNEEGEGMVFFQGSTDFNFRFPLVRMFTTAPSRIAQEEDVLLSVRAPVGTLNVANEKCCIGRGLAALNSKLESNSFVLYLMFYFKAMFDVQDRTGTTFGSIDKDTLYDLKFAKPPAELQKQFQSIVGKYDKMILTRSRETQELITLRDFLLPLLMNGQVMVK